MNDEKEFRFVETPTAEGQQDAEGEEGGEGGDNGGDSGGNGTLIDDEDGD